MFTQAQHKNGFNTGDYGTKWRVTNKAKDFEMDTFTEYMYKESLRLKLVKNYLPNKSHNYSQNIWHKF